MSTVFISGLITVLQQPQLMPGSKEECRKLLNLLLEIQQGLHDTELLPQTDEIKTWLTEFMEAAYDAEDILEEFKYAKLKAEVDADHSHSGDDVRDGIFYNCKVSRIRLPFKVGMMRERLRAIVKRFEDLVEKSVPKVSREGSKGFLPGAEGSQDKTLSSMNQIDAIIVGRDNEKEQIVTELLYLSRTVGNSIAVLPIIGPGGIGKSTLTRYICGDARIKDNFEFILWVDVGVEFNVPRIAKSLIDQVIGKDCCISESDTDLLGRRIYQELSGKRYLLVLDDVRNPDEREWQQLKSWLDQSAATGSSLIVTTRDGCLTTHDGSETYIMSSVIYKILPLRENDLWTLFCRSALIAEEEIYPEALEIRDKILNRCGGVPLAVNLLGGLMRFKQECAERQQVVDELVKSYAYHNDILLIPPISSLMNLCYNHLSSEIKQCFAFCSLFPKGHYMDKELLIKIWIANGLISSNGPLSLEVKGNCIFNELALRRFFVDVKLVSESSSGDHKHGYHSRVICKMHHLIHDLAEQVSENEYTVLPDRRIFSPKFRYLSISDDLLIDIPVLSQIYPHVRTFISLDDPFVRHVNCTVLPKLNSLRALHLHSAKFDRDLFELKYAKHLRCLDLSGSRIKRLPKSTSSLYFLQILDISKCLLLCELPQDMRYMRNLRHLYVHGCPKLKRMPAYLGQLRCLKTLTSYIVGENVGNRIDEIKGLKLGGLLELSNLRKVGNDNAKEVRLISKTNLERLSLCWGGHRLVMSKARKDFKVLEALQPHKGLKVLKIKQYGYHEFASWLANPVDLQNLVELHLIGCPKCETLPAVWKLSSLRVLCLKHMLSLISMFSITSFPGTEEIDSSKPFPSLKRLVLVSMKKLESWHNGEALQRTMLTFPVLDEMEITNCPELKTMPSVPILKYLTISTENHWLIASVIDLITQSESLIEVNMAKEIGSDNEALPQLGTEVEERNSHKLRVMRLDSTNCFFMAKAIPKLRLGFWRSLVSLENLDIANCNSIVAWPLEEFKALNRLKRLSVRMCANLTGSLPRGLQEGEKLLPQLQSLEFYRCLSLKEVPRCSSILYLELDECPEMTSIWGLNNLKTLFLSCTSWTALPDGFEDLEKLESIRVSECYSLVCLPDELAGLRALQTVFINKCPRIRFLPEGLNHMFREKKFQISECPELEKFCKGKSIFIFP